MINDRIHKIRKTLNLNQTDFGKALGITASSVSLLESGRNNPSEQTVRAICREFGVDYGWLKDGVGEMLVSQDTETLLAIDSILIGENEFAKSIFKAFSKMSASEWEKLRNFMSTLDGLTKEGNR